MTEERVSELFDSSGSALAICVGSWKLYNEGGRGSCGSYYEGHFYIDFEKLEGAEELKEVLAFIGWSEEDMEELFIQDYEATGLEFGNCDCINPMDIAEAIKDYNERSWCSGFDEEMVKKVGAIMDFEGVGFVEALDDEDNYYFHEGMTAEEVEEQYFWDCLDENARKILEEGWLSCYISIDFEGMAEDSDRYWETDDGVLERMQ